MAEQEYVFSAAEGPRIKLVSPDGLVTKELRLENDGTLNLESTPSVRSKIQTDGTNEIIVAITDYTRPYARRTSTSYGTMAHLLFEGTDATGTPTSIKLLAWSKNSSKTYDIRIVRSDNGDVIAGLTAQNNSVIDIKDLGALSNLPTTPTILEIQSKVQSGGECRLASISIKF